MDGMNYNMSMFLSTIKLWNFRKFGSNNDDVNRDCDLEVGFKTGLNLIVGENDSGKSSIVDAINYIITPYSYERLRISKEDFYKEQKRLRIECDLTGFSIAEAKNFIEYLSIEDSIPPASESMSEDDRDKWITANVNRLHLHIFLQAEIIDDSIGWYDIKVDDGEDGLIFRGEIRDYLRSMYLKPLRDAKSELSSRPSSRLSQVLLKHKNFKEDGSSKHPLTKIFQSAHQDILDFFDGYKSDETEGPGSTLIADFSSAITNYLADKDSENEKILQEVVKKIQGVLRSGEKRGKETYDEISNHIDNLFSKRNIKRAKFDISDQRLDQVLQKLNLELDEKKSGLGALNLLFIALELLLLYRDDHPGLKIGIIEEAEAHLHTQAQLRVLKYLQNIANDKKIQLILTTHSTQVASVVDLSNLILVQSDHAFSMDSKNTMLDKSDYTFLQRFLDATKANLFFAEGVILVEGDAENILLPAISKIIGKDLIDYGVSIVNVGHTGLFRYSRIFLRSDGEKGVINIPIACVKDNDVRYYDTKTEIILNPLPDIDQINLSREQKLADGALQNVRNFVSPNTTLEFDIAIDKILRKEFYRAVLYAEKAKNAVSSIYITDDKKVEADEVVESDFRTWDESGLSDEEIAVRIYLRCKDNKSVTAQFYAEYLCSALPEQLKTYIGGDETKIKYLTDAIRYATSPIDTDSPSPENT